MKLLSTSVILIASVLLIATATTTVTSSTEAQKYSDQFKQQQAAEDHPCLISGDPNMGTSVVQLRSDEGEDGQSTDDCLAYIDILIEQYGYKMFDVLSWGDNEYTWTLN